MQAADWIRLFQIVAEILGPIAMQMIDAVRHDQDPWAVLERERVEAIVPAPLKSELALLRAKARGAA